MRATGLPDWLDRARPHDPTPVTRRCQHGGTHITQIRMTHAEGRPLPGGRAERRVDDPWPLACHGTCKCGIDRAHSNAPNVASAPRRVVSALQGGLQIVQLWKSSASSDDWPRGRSIRAAVNSRSFGAAQPVGVGDLDLSPRGGSPEMLTWSESAGLCRYLDEIMVPLFRARPVAGPGAGRELAGRTVRRGRGWAAWRGRVRRRSQLPRRARRTRPRRAGRR